MVLDSLEKRKKVQEQDGGPKMKEMEAPGSVPLDKFNIENFLNPITREKALKELLEECEQLKEMITPISRFFKREHIEKGVVFQMREYLQQKHRIERKDFDAAQIKNRQLLVALKMLSRVNSTQVLFNHRK